MGAVTGGSVEAKGSGDGGSGAKGVCGEVKVASEGKKTGVPLW